MSSPSSGSLHLTPGHHHSSSPCVNTLSPSSQLWHSVPGCPSSGSPSNWSHALTLPGVSPPPYPTTQGPSSPESRPSFCRDTIFVCLCFGTLHCLPTLLHGSSPHSWAGHHTPIWMPLKPGLALTHTPGRYGSLPSAPSLAGPYPSLCHFVFRL